MFVERQRDIPVSQVEGASVERAPSGSRSLPLQRRTFAETTYNKPACFIHTKQVSQSSLWANVGKVHSLQVSQNCKCKTYHPSPHKHDNTDIYIPLTSKQWLLMQNEMLFLLNLNKIFSKIWIGSVVTVTVTLLPVIDTCKASLSKVCWENGDALWWAVVSVPRIPQRGDRFMDWYHRLRPVLSDMSW